MNYNDTGGKPIIKTKYVVALCIVFAILLFYFIYKGAGGK